MLVKCEGSRDVRQEALLDCQGRPSCGQWVPHAFSEVRFVCIETETTEDGRTTKRQTDEEIYKCLGCGAERRWGLLAKKIQ